MLDIILVLAEELLCVLDDAIKIIRHFNSCYRLAVNDDAFKRVYSRSRHLQRGRFQWNAGSGLEQFQPVSVGGDDFDVSTLLRLLDLGLLPPTSEIRTRN